MAKYIVTRTDGKDNSSEQYLVIRVDGGAKNKDLNRQIARDFINAHKDIDPEAFAEMDRFLKSIES